MTILLARYRRTGDTTTDSVEIQVEGPDYDTALADARARTADGDHLISVQTVQA